MMVTNDAFEFPLSLPMNLDQMVELTGMRADTIRGACTPSAMRKKANLSYHYKPWKIIAFCEEEQDDT